MSHIYLSLVSIFFILLASKVNSKALQGSSETTQKEADFGTEIEIETSTTEQSESTDEVTDTDVDLQVESSSFTYVDGLEPEDERYLNKLPATHTNTIIIVYVLVILTVIIKTAPNVVYYMLPKPKTEEIAAEEIEVDEIVKEKVEITKTKEMKNEKDQIEIPGYNIV